MQNRDLEVSVAQTIERENIQLATQERQLRPVYNVRLFQAATAVGRPVVSVS